MFETHHDAGDGDTVHTTLAVEDAAEVRTSGPQQSFTVTIGDVDLPAIFSNGVLYLQAPLPLIFEAFAEDLPDFLRDMEARISDSRGRSFSLDCDGRPVLSAGLAISSLVPNRGFRR